MTCPHQSRIRDRGQFTCVIGLYDGKPWHGNCLACTAHHEATGIRKQVAATAPDPKTWGPPKWQQLHTAAAANLLTPEWMDKFTASLPCGDCRSGWQAILLRLPVRWDDQYGWSVEAHNLTNVKLGKPVWEPSDASET